MKKNKKLIAIIAVVVLVVVVAIFAVIKCKKGEIGHTVGMDDGLEINVDNKKALIKVESIDTDIKVSEAFNTNNVHTFVGIKLSVTNKSDELLNLNMGYCYETLLDSNNNELDTSIIGMEDWNLSMDSERKDTFIKSEIEAGQTEVGYIYFETDSKDIKKLKISFRTKNKTNHKEINLGMETYYEDYYINLNMAKANSASNTNSITNDNSNTNENKEQTLWGNVSSTNTASSTSTNNSTNTSSSTSTNNSTNTSSSTSTNNSTNTSNSTSSNGSTNQSSGNTVSETQNVGSLEFKLPSNQYTLTYEANDSEYVKEKDFRRKDYIISIRAFYNKEKMSSIQDYIISHYESYGVSEDKIKKATINNYTWYYITYENEFGTCYCMYFCQKDEGYYCVRLFGDDESAVKQEANKMPSYFKFN